MVLPTRSDGRRLHKRGVIVRRKSAAVARASYVAANGDASKPAPASAIWPSERARIEPASTYYFTPALVLLTIGVAILLLIACLNVSNLLLLRASSSPREISVRRALGAAYGDALRQFVVEAGILPAAGRAAGLGLAVALIHTLAAFAPSGLPRLDDIQLSRAPLLIAIGVSAITVVLFGVGPAAFAARSDTARSLRPDARPQTVPIGDAVVRRIQSIPGVVAATLDAPRARCRYRQSAGEISETVSPFTRIRSKKSPVAAKVRTHVCQSSESCTSSGNTMT